MIEYVTGNLLKDGPRAIAHGCNAQGKMGSGIAAPIRAKFPVMYERYRTACEDGDLVLGDVMPWRQEADDGGEFLRVYNLITQTEPGPDGNLYGIAIAVRDMLHRMDMFKVPVVGMPRIGCGIAGLEWADVEEAINIAAMKYPHITIQVYTLPSELEKFAPVNKVHKARPTPSDRFHCAVCKARIKCVTGGNGPTWLHSDSGAVAAPGAVEGDS